MKIVADTNVLISALGWKGNEFELLRRVFAREVSIIISPDLFAELERVAAKQELGFGEDDIAAFFEAIGQVCELVLPEEKLTVVKDDPADDRVLECALAGGVDYIVSGDRHLLSLGVFRGIPIVTAQQFLQLVERSRG